LFTFHHGPISVKVDIKLKLSLYNVLFNVIILPQTFALLFVCVFRGFYAVRYRDLPYDITAAYI
ncbi:hypothetical protein, partial [Vibrio sp. M260118]